MPTKMKPTKMKPQLSSLKKKLKYTKETKTANRDNGDPSDNTLSLAPKTKSQAESSNSNLHVIQNQWSFSTEKSSFDESMDTSFSKSYEATYNGLVEDEAKLLNSVHSLIRSKLARRKMRGQHNVEQEQKDDDDTKRINNYSSMNCDDKNIREGVEDNNHSSPEEIEGVEKMDASRQFSQVTHLKENGEQSEKQFSEVKEEDKGECVRNEAKQDGGSSSVPKENTKILAEEEEGAIKLTKNEPDKSLQLEEDKRDVRAQETKGEDTQQSNEDLSGEANKRVKSSKPAKDSSKIEGKNESSGKTRKTRHNNKKIQLASSAKFDESPVLHKEKETSTDNNGTKRGSMDKSHDEPSKEEKDSGECLPITTTVECHDELRRTEQAGEEASGATTSTKPKQNDTINANLTSKNIQRWLITKYLTAVSAVANGMEYFLLTTDSILCVCHNTRKERSGEECLALPPQLIFCDATAFSTTTVDSVASSITNTNY